jgi:hypothetical protein
MKPTIVFFILPSSLFIAKVAGLIGPFLLSQPYISETLWSLSRMKIKELPKDKILQRPPDGIFWKPLLINSSKKLRFGREDSFLETRCFGKSLPILNGNVNKNYLSG